MTCGDQWLRWLYLLLLATAAASCISIADRPPADAVPDAEPETVADVAGELDAGGPVWTASAEAIGAECVKHCQKIGLCGDLAAAGGSIAECARQCEEQAGDDLFWIGSYACMGEVCDAAACLGGPIAPFDACAGLCERLTACELAASFQLQEHEPGLCMATCSGSAPVVDYLPALIDCVATGLAEGCDQAVITTCSAAPGAVCPSICAHVFTGALNDGVPCLADAAIFDTWEDPAACVADCSKLTSEQMNMFSFCLAMNRCAEASWCLDLPPAPFVACDDVCEAFQALCPDIEGIADRDACNAMCTVIVDRVGADAPKDDAATCIAGYQTCPDDDDVASGVLLGCSVPLLAVCRDLCEPFAGCPGAPDPALCGYFCASAIAGDAFLAEGLEECLAAAAAGGGGDLTCAGLTACWVKIANARR